MAKPLYIFLDEGGNFDFSPNGTKYFTFTSITTIRPFLLEQQINSLRFDLIEQGDDIEYFHASENKQFVRNDVFGRIAESVSSFDADSIIVDKCKTNPSLRSIEKFYPRMLGYLLKHVIKYRFDNQAHSEIIVITDRLPVNKNKSVVEKAVKLTMAHMLPNDTPYRLLHHDSKSCGLLQVADYVNWGIYRKWNRKDSRSWEIICAAIKSEFDIFKTGTMKWY